MFDYIIPGVQRNNNFQHIHFPAPPINSTDDAMRFDILPDCAIYIQIKLKRVTDGGDHDVAICEVLGTGVWNDSERTVIWLKNDTENAANQFSALDHTSALYSGQLRSQGIM